jgi:hypothetical protein
MTPESWSNEILAPVVLLLWIAGLLLSWVVLRSPRRSAHRRGPSSSEMREQLRAVADWPRRWQALSQEGSDAGRKAGATRAGAASAVTR